VRKRLLVVATVIVLALGVAVAVWASGGTSDSGSSGKPEDCEKTITVQDTGSPKMMEYRRQDCDDEFAVTRSQGGGG
jgi:hypothetical protein